MIDSSRGAKHREAVRNIGESAAEKIEISETRRFLLSRVSVHCIGVAARPLIAVFRFGASPA